MVTLFVIDIISLFIDDESINYIIC